MNDLGSHKLQMKILILLLFTLFPSSLENNPINVKVVHKVDSGRLRDTCILLSA
jgi:hypothetical protein